ncbi:hypothetical protein ALC53_12949 [Atta colombica]|uniref:Uncharacterized protein n=1 Tax=Atta colombica TaxID=520822 RepID=A0A151HYA5_9HYME|nr:hypothetical protein ALC53_12949 [Atta colombica]
MVTDCAILPTNMRAQPGSDASNNDDDATRKKTPNSKQLRDFSGFDFDSSDKFREKLEYATTFSIGDLTSMCNIFGLDYISAKEELTRKNIEHNDDVIDQRINKEVSVASMIIDTDAVNSERTRRDTTKISFNFKDVEDTIRPFYGSNCYLIEKWIADFEDLAILFKWNDVQKLVFGHKSLKGKLRQQTVVTIVARVDIDHERANLRSKQGCPDSSIIRGNIANFVFDFKQEIVKYYRNDIDILRCACMAFRKLFLERGNVCPFVECTTIASTCMKVFRKNFLRKEEIGIIPLGRREFFVSVLKTGSLGQSTIYIGEQCSELIGVQFRVTRFDPCTRQGSFFVEYINSFFKLKQEASGWPSECQDDESKERYLQEYKETEGIIFDRSNIIQNLDLCLVAKLCLNSGVNSANESICLIIKRYIERDHKGNFLDDMTDKLENYGNLADIEFPITSKDIPKFKNLNNISPRSLISSRFRRPAHSNCNINYKNSFY